MVNEAISKLITYAQRTGLIEECETPSGRSTPF